VTMAEESTPRGSNKSSRLFSGAAGAGSGTLLVLLANNLPPSNPWKSWLVIAAPSATVFASVVWIKATAALNAYLRKRELDDLLKRAQVTVVEAMKNDKISAEDREQLQSQYGQLQLLLFQSDVERIKTLRLQR